MDFLTRLRIRQDKRQSLRRRLNAKARELALRDQERYFRAMVNDLMHGRLAEDLVDYWEPLSGDIGTPARKEV